MRAIKRIVLAASLFAPLLVTFTVQSQSQPQATPAAAADDKSKEAAEEGIPVKSQIVIDRCSSCHKKDEKSNLTRISFERKTPEGWQETLKRMIRLNGLTISPDEAKQIVKYLSNNHGLAPEEAKPAFYEAEKRVIDEKLPDESLRATCILCHSLGRVLSQRRSKEEWDLLGNLHVGMFPVVTFQGFYRFPQPPGAPPPTDPDPRHPLEKSLDYLAKNLPLTSAEWGAWRANMRTPKLQGRWLVSGYQIGRGRIYGEMVVEPAQAEDEFTTRTTLRYTRDGVIVTRSGRGIVYSGYSWRGRSASSDGKEPAENREAMFVSRDWTTMDGRWFWGAYDEFGVDVTLRRITGEPLIAGVNPTGLKSPSQATQVHIYGANLPSDIKREEIDFGPGVIVKRVVSAKSDDVTVEVDVADGAANGYRDISLRRFFGPRAVAVFDKVDYIKVTPDAGMARVGGVNFPKQFQQFEAIAPVEVTDAPGAGELRDVRGEIGFENVTLKYDRDTVVLDSVSFKIPAGSLCAIAGPSGVGKSTIADLLLRFYDPQAGVIRIDGRDLRDVRLADLRREIVLVEQTAFLFNSTIAGNIRYGRPDATIKEIMQAAKAASIDEFIRSLPDGYDTEVGERGQALSAGERQRIALARAMLRDPAVLVLDEPTASVDPITEQTIAAELAGAMKGRTTVVISHRLSLIERADWVIVIDNGSVVESGRPDELLTSGKALAALFSVVQQEATKA